MTDEVSKGTSEIEALLADRQRLQNWLAKLDAAKAPVAVRSRVQADYEGRLAEVVVRLRGFSEALTGSLAEQRSRLNDVHAVKTEAEEERAEASLRHTVGEYSDTEWQEYEAASTTQLEGLQADIDALADEIGRLEEVLAQVSPEPEPVEAPVAVAKTAPVLTAAAEEPEALDVEVIEPEELRLESRQDDVEADLPTSPAQDQAGNLGLVDEAAERPRPLEAPRFIPKASEAIRRERPTRTLRFPKAAPASETAGPNVDEMTFLKSVALESPEAPEARPARGANAKTLKCVECGSMNRPTEWYCERCGAELAAL